jgi:hypothetical protein
MYIMIGGSQKLFVTKLADFAKEFADVTITNFKLKTIKNELYENG